jgi:hypothetical protein
MSLPAVRRNVALSLDEPGLRCTRKEDPRLAA